MNDGGHSREDAERFALELPSHPAYVATARLFAASIARGFAYGEDTVEDLKIAVSEACSDTIERAHGSPVRMTIARSVDGITVEVSAEVSGGSSASDENLLDRLAVVQGLFEGADRIDDAARPLIRFFVPPAEPAP